MISLKKLIRMARKWRKMTSTSRKTISYSRINHKMDLDNGNSSFVAERGHFVIYTMDWKRFAMPLAYLSNDIFRQLFKMSEEEFGVSSDRPIILPCDSTFMDYIVSLIQQGVAKDLEKDLINSIITRQRQIQASIIVEAKG